MKRKKRKPMPKWIWQLPHSVLNYKLKHLLAYFWWCGDRGCQRWNYAIAKRFKVSDRTIRRWIHSLQTKHLIYINFPMKTTRTIYRRPYYTRLVWWSKSGQIKDISKKSQKTSQTNHSRPKVAYISNAQRTNLYQQEVSTPFKEGNGGEKHPATIISPSNAGGLSGSRVLRTDFPTTEGYWIAKLEELFDQVGVSRKHPAQVNTAKLKESKLLAASNDATESTAPHDKVVEM